jgi:uncharacterized coiled-coil protein SlyX
MTTELDSALKESVIAELRVQVAELSEKLKDRNKVIVALVEDLKSTSKGFSEAQNALLEAQDLLHKFMTRYPALINHLIPIRDVLTLDKS